MENLKETFGQARILFRECLAPRMGLFWRTLLVVVAFNLVDVAFPKILQLYVDSIAGNPVKFWSWALPRLDTPFGRQYIFPAMLLVAAVLRWLLTYGRSFLQTRLGQGALYDLRNRIYETMQNLSFAYHDRVHSGTFISNIIEDVAHASNFLESGALPFLENLSYVIFVYVILFIVCWPAALVSLALACLSSPVIWGFFRHGFGFFLRTRTLFTDTVSDFTESMEGYLVIRSFGRHQDRIKKYNRRVQSFHKARWKERILFTMLSQSVYLPAVIGNVSVVALALYLMKQGWALTSGTIFFLFLLQSTLVNRFGRLTEALDAWMRFMISARRIAALFSADEFLADVEKTSAEAAPLPPFDRCRLSLENVSFNYPGRPHSLSGVSCAIEPGQTVGLVGETGAGKSTLALLLCRFYDPSDGVILLGDRDIRLYPVREVRKHFSLVFQDTFLFSASIRENIAYGRPGASFEEVVHVATLAHIHDFIMELPDKYDTMVGERGVTLSGGQRQRLSIARALLRKPRFLVLDDCTSSLDMQTEQAIQESLAAWQKKTTLIVIAHRLSSLQEADVVYVLQDGRIIEQGRPAELNVPGTAFSRILQTQAETTP
ncbi:MAG: ABC transporter ATP-binding protein [Planctomycetota bacterium]